MKRTYTATNLMAAVVEGIEECERVRFQGCDPAEHVIVKDHVKEFIIHTMYDFMDQMHPSVDVTCFTALMGRLVR